MFVDGSRSDLAAAEITAQQCLASIRAQAGVRIVAHHCDGRSRLSALAEHGGYRAKFPDTRNGSLEAVIINTGGGVVSGDRVHFEAHAVNASRLTVTSSTAERVYRSTGASADVNVKLSVASRSTLAWLPQPTILFSGSRFERRIVADVDADACLLIGEITAFGRISSGETMGQGLLRDRWEIRRNGRLIFAEAALLDGDFQAMLAKPAVADGSRCIALLILVSENSGERTDAVRTALAASPSRVGVSAWNGLLALRAVTDRLEDLQIAMRLAVQALGVCAMPAAWINGHN